MRKMRETARILSLILLISTAGLSGCAGIGEIVEWTGEFIGKIFENRGDASEEEEAAEEEPLQAESVSGGLYVYGTLDEETQEVYDEVLYALQNREESVLVATTDIDVLKNAYLAVYSDYCDIFWSDSYEYELYSDGDGSPTKLYFRPVYDITAEEQEAYQQEIDAEAERMLEGISEDASDYEKVYYVYTVLIQETTYELESENNQNIISTFVNHETVCKGYAYGAQYLLEKLGISCTTISGTSQGANHAWNLVVMDGAYYYMDVTWGEVEYWGDLGLPESIQSEEIINYSYLGVSDADTEFMDDHQASDYITLPACTATADNYFVQEGLYFSEWDRNTAAAMIRKAWEAGDSYICLKFADLDLYSQAYDYLITQNGWQHCVDTNRIVYIDQFGTNVLMIYFL